MKTAALPTAGPFVESTYFFRHQLCYEQFATVFSFSQRPSRASVMQKILVSTYKTSEGLGNSESVDLQLCFETPTETHTRHIKPPRQWKGCHPEKELVHDRHSIHFTFQKDWHPSLWKQDRTRTSAEPYVIYHSLCSCGMKPTIPSNV